ncbi:SseB family protein [Pseudolactococcus insecticola]|uniref:SseB protein N-terminal domain-containing protein n=1 Tax=Pseudolactococcus insecticola TaxID=2709158 RepID=A0A6A0BAQ0_9LACT|nr:SseB family protein [Lactococcus insecticola]GFH40917.1 hypothetical protein Hs20B_13150 [Lactococcus insecticola]
MTDYQFYPELDARVQGFVARAGNFIDDIGFVHALHAFPVVAVAEPFVVPIEDKKLIPVFTTAEALETFKSNITEQLTYVNKNFMSVVSDLVDQEFDAIAFNLQPAGQDAANTTMLPREHLVPFINRYTDVLNKLFSPENQAAAQADKYYLMPAFTRTTPEDEVARIFATLSNPSGESFVPVFSNLLSFAKWYNNENFGQPFQENNGVVLTWQLKDIQNPSTGFNELDDVIGVAVDPFDAENYDESVILWADLNK